MSLAVCPVCGTHTPKPGCCPHCHTCTSRKLAAPAAALLGLLACNGPDTGDIETDTGGFEPPYGIGAFDADGDGFNEDVDCNDSDPDVNPGAAEVPGDGIDNNCNAEIDE